MKLLNSSGNLTKAEVYKLAHSNSGINVSEKADEDISLGIWALYEEDEKRVLSIMDTDGTVYGTISETFIKAFINMVKYFDPDPVNVIHVVPGVSKNGNHFITCDYVA